MNAPLFDDLIDQLRGGPASDLGQRLGIPPEAALQAASAALPLLLGAMHRNATSPTGAGDLLSALEVDHRGVDPTNALATALAGGGSGAGILGHLFGGRRDVAPQVVGQATGLGTDRSAMLLRVLAPVVMAYLARRLFTPRAADGPSTPQPSPEGLRQALDGEVQALRERQPSTSGLLSFLDRDHDGDVDFADFGGANPQGLGAPGTQTAEMRSPRPRI